MSFPQILRRICEGLVQIRQSDEVEVLRSTPVETLYLALKESDSDTALWVFENATAKQIQRIIDLDCWTGSHFEVERFWAHFRSVVECEPERVAELFHKTDLELWVRALLEHVQVVDYDPQNPPEWPENQWLLSYDNKYALLLKNTTESQKEHLRLWLNKHSAGDLEHHRKILEACKWELISDLEEFAYQIQKGRLEEIGFVDRHEALALYAVGHAVDLKKKILEQAPLKKTSTREAESLEMLPTLVKRALHSQGLFSEALKTLDRGTQELVLQEKLRVIHAAFAADDLIHSSLDDLAQSAERSHRLMELGLFFLSQGHVRAAAESLETRPLFQIYRLGWLMQQDLIRVAKQLATELSPQLLTTEDLLLLKGLHGRHPHFDDSVLQLWGWSTSVLWESKGLVGVGRALVDIKAWAEFMTQQDGILELDLKEAQALPALLTALFRKACGQSFQFEPIDWKDFQRLSQSFDKSLWRTSLEKKVQGQPSFVKERVLDAAAEIEQLVSQRGTPVRPEWTGAFWWKDRT